MTPRALDALPAEFRDAVRQAARMHGVSIESLVGEAWICATSGKTIDFFQSRIRREHAAPFSRSRLEDIAAVWEASYQPPEIPGGPVDEAEPAAILSTREIAARDGVTIRAAQIRRKKWLAKQRLAIESGQRDLFGGAL
ncbi:hypothetical protein HF288_08295 [Acidithiobacillus caldus]|uniref:hypothetical protein n=1 Tax=Acidithiobacillus caldus TaxID=33059 RepID=UPI001C066306|nr:hypothetical protein [Acidithiobacillus caldus]MBU2789994.1 hypothetical protein [Acidithiobacillus caldus]MBU2821318.1 hypothetical protein [Acidithiobacillus caldus]